MPRRIDSLFFVMSGEHPTLPKAELLAIIESLEVPYRVKGSAFKLVEVEADPGIGEIAAERAGFIDECGVEIFHSPATYGAIDESIKDIQLDNYLRAEDSFSVRISRFGEDADGVSRVKLESSVGGLLAEKTEAKVSLGAPHKLFRGILTGGDFHFGLVAYQRPKGSVARRRPRKRPAFHPSTMVPKLARCMVNLSQVSRDDTFLDPFCGIGGILIEAGMLGCRVVGIDALPRMLRGSRRNLAHFGLDPLGLVRGDARCPPVRGVDGIATDPPYGTGASTLKSTTRRILEDFLPRARDVLDAGSRMVVASPKGTLSTELAQDNGFKIADRHQVYVHSSLTREIQVMVAV